MSDWVIGFDLVEKEVGVTGRLLRSMALSAVLALAVAGLSFAQEPAAAPGVDAERVRQEAQALFREVMSPFCPGLTLADCPSPAAFELRKAIDARLQRGESRQAIVDELVAKYGTELLSDPSDTPIGRVVWGVPIVLSILAALGLAVFVRRSTRLGDPSSATPGAEPATVRSRLDEELAALD